MPITFNSVEEVEKYLIEYQEESDEPDFLESEEEWQFYLKNPWNILRHFSNEVFTQSDDDNNEMIENWKYTTQEECMTLIAFKLLYGSIRHEDECEVQVKNSIKNIDCVKFVQRTLIARKAWNISYNRNNLTK